MKYWVSLSLTFVVWVLPIRSTDGHDGSWPMFSFTEVISDSNLRNIIDIQNGGDGSGTLYLASLTGEILAIEGDGEGGLSVPVEVLDIGDRIYRRGESGLLGIAFPPSFGEKRHFYVYYVEETTRDGVLSRFRLLDDQVVADPASEEIVFRSSPVTSSNHRGGQIGFGPDGLLYLSIGDARQYDLAQDASHTSGSILRIDVEDPEEGLAYRIPATNPRANSVDEHPEILYTGLRNPWRFSFDQEGGNLFITDLGEDSREELNVISSEDRNEALNFGWPYYEGALRTSMLGSPGGFTSPVLDYSHNQDGIFSGGCYVVGGVTYRGLREDWNGVYFFGDPCAKKVWGLRYQEGSWVSELLHDEAPSFHTFGVDESGEIYCAGGGSIYRLEPQTKVDTPTGYPPEGEVLDEGAVLAGVSTDTPFAYITYAFGDEIPKPDSPEFIWTERPSQLSLEHEGLLLPPDTQVNLRAFRNGMEPSDPVMLNYSFIPAPPSSVPRSRNLQIELDSFKSIRLTHPDESSIIRYEVGGSTAGPESPVYNEVLGIVPTSDSFNISTYASVPGKGESKVRTFKVRVQIEIETPGRYYSPGELLDIRSPTQDVSLHFTTDGSQASSESPLWEGPLIPEAGTEFRLLADHAELYDKSLIFKTSSIDPVTCRLEQIGTSSLAPSGLIVTPDRQIHVLTPSSIWTVSGDQTKLLQATPTQAGNAIQFSGAMADADGNIHVVYKKFFTNDTGTQIQVFRPPYYEKADMLISPQISSLDVTLHRGGDGDVLVLWDGTLSRYRFETNDFEYVRSFENWRLPDGSVAAGPPSRVVVLADGSTVMTPPDKALIWRESIGGWISALAGNPWSAPIKAGYKIDGLGGEVVIDEPTDIVPGLNGEVYLLDGGAIRLHTPEGALRTLSGPVIDNKGGVIEQDYLTRSNISHLVGGPNGEIYVFGSLYRRLMRLVILDSDGDHVLDRSETLYGHPFTVGADDRMKDSDLDGCSDAAEHWFGTSPNDRFDCPGTATIRRLESGWFAIFLPRGNQSDSPVEFSQDLDRWFSFSSGMESPDGDTSFIHTPRNGLKGTFFRRSE